MEQSLNFGMAHQRALKPEISTMLIHHSYLKV